MTKPIKLTDRAAYQRFVDRYDTLLLDCDGVIWSAKTIIPGVLQVLKYFRKKGKQLLFVTNNSTRSRASNLKKLQAFGIEASEEEIFSSSYAAAYYLRHMIDFPKEKKVYIIGESGIEDELNLMGVKNTKADTDNGPMQNWDFADITPDPEIGAVLCGFDTFINYRKIAKAFVYLRTDPDCLFLLTNDDTTFPANGTVYPGSGSLSSTLITALNRKPDRVMGKPNKPMLDCIVDKYHLNVERTCMIGDRLDTDIQFGINGGIDTLLVLTGVSTEKEILAEDAPILPDYYVDSLSDFAEIIEL